jgi:hypothetical protein
MKKLIALGLALVCAVGLFGCGNQSPERTEIIEGNFRTYYKLSDDTWEYDGQIYKYRLVIKGTMPNAKTNSTFTYLSNIENITFERAWKAAGLSSNMNDYFSVEDAVLVDWLQTDS